MTTANVREVTAREAWEALKRSEAQILDLRTKHERRRYGWPPGARRVSLLRHLVWPEGEGTIYLCQHANRSKLTRWRGAAEIAGGWKAWRAQGLPVERAESNPGRSRPDDPPAGSGRQRRID